MNILLLGGMWLTASAWAAVANALNAAGHNAIAPILPQHATATLRDQLDAALAALPAGPSLVVGHSAACSLAWMVADAAPTQGVVLIGGFPKAHGEAYFPHLEPVDGWVKFPGWAEFAGPDSADLTAAQQQAVQGAMVPVPASVTQSRVELTNPARYETPVTIICPEFSPADVREWTARGFLPELSPTARLLDFGSGHWPMASCPDELARVLDELAGELAAAKAYFAQSTIQGRTVKRSHASSSAASSPALTRNAQCNLTRDPAPTSPVDGWLTGSLRGCRPPKKSRESSLPPRG